MSPTLTCLALALAGVDLGYRPASNGGTEFIIQISPTTLQAWRPGDPFDIDVPREAQALRPTHFRIATGNDPLPHLVSDVTSAAPAVAPIGPATPVMSASATSSVPSPAPPKSTIVHDRPLLTDANPANSAGSRIPGMANINAEADRPWLGMCLFVIALLASNVYLGWLFWDARQRYRGLLARTFSFGQQAAEAS